MLRFVGGIEKGAGENSVLGLPEGVVCFVDGNQ